MSLFSSESSFTLAEAGTKNNVLTEHIPTELWWLWEQVRGWMHWLFLRLVAEFMT